MYPTCPTYVRTPMIIEFVERGHKSRFLAETPNLSIKMLFIVISIVSA
jgi:hypothetical protein